MRVELPAVEHLSHHGRMNENDAQQTKSLPVSPPTPLDVASTTSRPRNRGKAACVGDVCCMQWTLSQISRVSQRQQSRTCNSDEP
eukprot:811050-Pleurochrysis_carterae.AAC.1